MKNYLVIIFLLLLYGCEDYFSSQLIVNGKITDYLTGEPLKNIPLLFTTEEPFCAWSCDDYIIDTFYTDNSGNYSFEYYKDSTHRFYHVVPIPPVGYAYSPDEQIISAVDTNKIDFSLKPLIKVHIKLINKPDDYNAMFLYNDAITRYRSEFLNDPNATSKEEIRCYGSNCDTIQHIIPDETNKFHIGLSHYYDGNWGNTKDSSYSFNAGVKDTTFTFYY